jgi:hypothetical protein
VRLEELGQLKNSTSSGLEPATYASSMYVYSRGGPKTAPAPRPSLIYCALASSIVPRPTTLSPVPENSATRFNISELCIFPTVHVDQQRPFSTCMLDTH